MLVDAILNSVGNAHDYLFSWGMSDGVGENYA